jgi:hypothetical protein
VLLRRGGTPIGYRVQVRDGTSTVLGTTLGGAYLTPRYPSRSPRERRDLRRFVVELFEAAAPRKVVPDDDLEVETVARLSPDGGCLLFVINRLGAQTGALRFPYPAALNLGDSLRAEVLFSHLGSSAAAANDGLRLDLAAGDTVVVRLR